MGALTTATQSQLVELNGFRGLLARLDPDPVKAWEAHEDLRKKLIAYFEHNHFPDPDELAEEALDRIAKRPDVQSLQNIVEFAFGVARNLRKESLRKASQRAEVPDMELIEDTSRGNGSLEDAVINRLSEARKLQCFQKSMQNLSAEERAMVRRYYPAENGDLEAQRLNLAADLGISVGTLRTRMARIKERLQEDFNRYYYGPKRELSERRGPQPGNFCALNDSNISDRDKVGAFRFEVENQRWVRTGLQRLRA